MGEATRFKLLPNIARDSPPPITPNWPVEPDSIDNERNIVEDDDSTRFETILELGMQDAITEEMAGCNAEERRRKLQQYVEMYGKISCLQNNELFLMVAKGFIDNYMDLLSKVYPRSDMELKTEVDFEFKYRRKRNSYESHLHCGMWMLYEREPCYISWSNVLKALDSLRLNGLLDKLFAPEHREKWAKLRANTREPVNRKQPVESITPEENNRDSSQTHLSPQCNQPTTNNTFHNNTVNSPDSGVESFPSTNPTLVEHPQSILTAPFLFSNDNSYQTQAPGSQWNGFYQQSGVNMTVRGTSLPVPMPSMNFPITAYGYNSLYPNPSYQMPSTVATIPRSVSNPTVQANGNRGMYVLISHSVDAAVEADRLAKDLWEMKRITGITVKYIKDNLNESIATCLDHIFRKVSFFVPILSPMYICDIDRSDSLSLSVCENVLGMNFDQISSLIVKRIHCEMENRYINAGCRNYYVRPVHTPQVTIDVRKKLGPYLLNSRRLWDDEEEFIKNLTD